MPLQLIASSISDYEIVTNPSAFLITTSSPTWFPDGMVEAVGFQNPGNSVEARFKSRLENYWFSFYVTPTETGGGAGLMYFKLFQVAGWPFSKASKMDLEFRQTTVHIRAEENRVASAATQLTAGVPNRIDVRVKVHATLGEISVYLNGVLTVQYLGDTARGQVGHDSFQIVGGGNTAWYTNIVSALVINTGDTRLFLLKSMAVTGDGTLQEWTGSYTDIDEKGAVNFADFILADEPLMASTFQFTKPITPVGYNIRAFVFSATLSKATDELEGVDAVWYDGETVVSFGSYSRLDIGFTNDQVITENNPVTGLKYTDAELAAFEFGFQTT